MKNHAYDWKTTDNEKRHLLNRTIILAENRDAMFLKLATNGKLAHRP